MYQRPTAPLSIGGVFESGLQLSRASFNDVFILAFVAAFVGQMPNEMLSLDTLDPAGPTPVLTTQAVIVIVGALLTALLMFGAVVGRINAVASGTELSLGGSLQLGLQRGPYVFATAVIFGFVGGTVLVIAKALTPLLYLPALALLVLYSLAAYPVVIRNMGPLTALSYCQSLVLSQFLRTALLLAMMVACVMFLYVFVAVLVGLVVSRGGGSDPTLAAIPWYINLVVLPLLGAVATVFVYSMSLSIFYDLELRASEDDQQIARN